MQLKIKNGSSWESIPAGGVGVPSGGSSGQYLKKSSSTDYATEWTDLPKQVKIKRISATFNNAAVSNVDSNFTNAFLLSASGVGV